VDISKFVKKDLKKKNLVQCHLTLKMNKIQFAVFSMSLNESLRLTTFLYYILRCFAFIEVIAKEL